MKKSDIKTLIKEVIRRQMEEDHGLGYSHNVSLPDPRGGDRDPLTDPLLTGKPLKENQYQKDFERLRDDSLRDYEQETKSSGRWNELADHSLKAAYKTGFEDGYRKAKEGY